MAQLPQWLAGLNEEDLQFLKRFLLASSLKALAKITASRTRRFAPDSTG